jgi:predicted nuclease of predicted toxin-antitoxin system
MPHDWEVWLDTNISPIIAKWINDYTEIPAKSSYTLSLHSMSDNEIYTLAKNQGNIILVSKDSDFAELISRKGSPPKLINLKIGNCDNRALWALLKPHIFTAVQELTSSEVDIIDIE